MGAQGIESLQGSIHSVSAHGDGVFGVGREEGLDVVRVERVDLLLHHLFRFHGAAGYRSALPGLVSVYRFPIVAARVQDVREP